MSLYEICGWRPTPPVTDSARPARILATAPLPGGTDSCVEHDRTGMVPWQAKIVLLAVPLALAVRFATRQDPGSATQLVLLAASAVLALALLHVVREAGAAGGTGDGSG